MNKIKRIKRVAFRIIIGISSLVVLLFLIVTAPFWWRHWVTYPKLEKERTALSLKYQAPTDFSGKQTYKGVLHAHSFWSHDSRGVLSEILPAAKKAKLDFIFFSDHKHSKLDSFPRSFHGIYDGIIMESGTESNGMMISPMQEGIVNWEQTDAQLIKSVVETGGFVGYLHSEEEHDWANPDFQAMEIYNIHTDLKDEEKTFLLHMIVNAAINGHTYRHWAYRELFDTQDAILKHWDNLNEKRRIVGFAAVDAHNNQSFRARYAKEGQVEWVGPNAKTLKIVEPGWKEKLLLGKPDEAGWAFKFEIDTYFDSFNFVNTHIFCDTFSNRDLIDHLVKGHAFISFENLAEAKGFQFFARDSLGNTAAIMGDSLSVQKSHQLIAVSPFPVKFTLLKDGEIKAEAEEAYQLEFDPKQAKGNYRIEARISLNDEWVPWVYTNPIYLY
ncbi:MAG: hypothetical protein R2828_26330 [Saprospiraceae bacterium]